MNFDQAFNVLMDREGGYSNDPADGGGVTKYGISKKSYPNLDIASLTLADAKAIYLRDYWSPCKCDQLPDAIRYDVFDAAVNSGIYQAVKWLQMACGAPIDGRIGPVTIAKAQSASGQSMRLLFNSARLLFYTSLPNFSRFGAGWVNRVAKNMTL